MEDKKAAAEARRQRILARGRDRLAQITGAVSSETGISVELPESHAELIT